MKTLLEIFDKNKCDKGSIRHRYDRVYEPKLQHLRDKKFKLLEIGVFKGNSLASWLEFFPHAKIFGIDIFKKVPAKKVPILNNPRISWYNNDSTKEPTQEIKKAAEDGFDVIIDDGLHYFDAQRLTFKGFFPLLNIGGFYFIEDVWPFNNMNNKEKQHGWLKKHEHNFSNKQYDDLIHTIISQNVTFHDLRKGYKPDTFIIEIRK